jgi:hypothetical protein
LQLYFDNSRCHTTQVIQEQIEVLQCKQVLYPTYSPDLAISDFYLFGKIKEELRTMQASFEEEIVEVVTDILRRIPHPELKSVFDH